VKHVEAQAPDADDRLIFLMKQVASRQEDFHTRRRADRKKSFYIQMATVGLSASITVLLGLRLDEPWRQRLANVALILGACITVLAAAEAFYRHRNLWLIWSTTAHQLDRLQRHLELYQIELAGRPPDDSRIKYFMAELDRILWEDQQAWLRLRETDPQGRVAVKDHLSGAAGPSTDSGLPTTAPRKQEG
jgi:hypothetical protein